MKPQILFVGPTKCGTTWIDQYLRGRPEVCLPKLVKETFFFDKRYHRGTTWYEGHFEVTDRTKVCVEIAPSLFAKPEAIQRVAKDLPGVKVVCTLRDPVDRAVSHYFHYLKAGNPDIGFAAMCNLYPDIVESGRYPQYLAEWENAVGKEQLIILAYDQIRSAPESFCAELCNVIGIDYAAPSPDILVAKVNSASVPRHPVLAQAVWRGAEIARTLGAHRLVNTLRGSILKRLAYGVPPQRDHRQQIREQALHFYKRLDVGN